MNYKTGSFYQCSVGKAFLWLGKISYSLYLLHPLVNDLIVVQDNPVLNVLVQTAASIAVAYLAYTFIEKPGIALGKKFLNKKATA
jgi:peptidoglycan/LPS O-acetylase OafA/YrhL